MTSILTSDLHLTLEDRDAHRFGILPWLKKKARKHKADQVIVMGDLTVNKDRHPSELVNAIVDGFTDLAREVKVIILAGNHDCIDPRNPFFKFMSNIPGLTFVTAAYPMILKINDHRRRALFLANSRDFWRDYSLIDRWERFSYVFMHQTFKGAISENGTPLDGLAETKELGYVREQIYSGDIHVPQKLGKITYVGAPYRVRFGDTFNPRVLLLKDGKERDLHFKTINKHLFEVRSLEDLKDCKAPRDDQVKVRFHMNKEDFPDWQKIRRSITELANQREWDLSGVEMKLNKPKAKAKAVAAGNVADAKSVVERYAKKNKVDEHTKSVGLKLLEAKNG